MHRVVAVIVAVILAAGLAFVVLHEHAGMEVVSTPVERLLGQGRIQDAQRELESVRRSVDPATADYLEGLILLAETNDRDASKVLERARSARPDDWRIVSASAAAAANCGRAADALAMVETYSTAHPDDERGLAVTAGYRLDERAGPIDPSRALVALDRIAALPARVAPAGDPTAVPESALLMLRTKASILAGRSVEGLQNATKLVDATPQDAEAWYLLGDAARLAKKPDRSLDAYQRAVALAPGRRRYGEQYVMALLDFVLVGKEKPRLESGMAIIDGLLRGAPDDVDLMIKKARLYSHLEEFDAANDIYARLLKQESLTKKQRIEVLRNRGVLLYDWKGGGRPGDYLNDARDLLDEYRRLGGEIDADLKDAWEELHKPPPPSGEKKPNEKK